jgi:hypothetical protein
LRQRFIEKFGPQKWDFAEHSDWITDGGGAPCTVVFEAGDTITTRVLGASDKPTKPAKPAKPDDDGITWTKKR